MARIPFQKPRTIEWEVLSDRYGRLVAEPFEKGYALTVGHSLRRTLLSIVAGSGVQWARVDGVPDPVTRIPGVAEEAVEVFLNLKKLAVNVPSGETIVARLEARGPGPVTGAEIVEGTKLEVLNPELPLATLTAGATLGMDLGIGLGRGYVAADRHPPGTVPAGAVALDTAYSPIQRVAYEVEPARLGKISDYEKLVIEIWTNGAVSPDEALTRAAGHMRQHFTLLAATAQPDDDEAVEATSEGFLQESLARAVEELPLSARAVNALKNAEILTVADLVQKTDEDLEHVKNLGDKSIEEIKIALAGFGLSLGMRIDPDLLGALERGESR